MEIRVWETDDNGEKVDINGADVSLPVESFIYTGQEMKPEFAVQYSGVSLIEGEDFTVSYTDNINTGIAHLVITGIGGFQGSKTADFAITPRDLADEAVEIQIADKVIFNRKPEYKPEPVISIYGFVLPEEDYILTYENNNAVTKEDEPAKVTITGAGNLVGELERTFAIAAEQL